METSSLRTLKIMPRNLNKIERYRRLKPHGTSMLLELRVHATQGIELTSSRLGVRRSNQIASWPVELFFISGGFYSSLQYHVGVLNAKSFVSLLWRPTE